MAQDSGCGTTVRKENCLPSLSNPGSLIQYRESYTESLLYIVTAESSGTTSLKLCLSGRGGQKVDQHLPVDLEMHICRSQKAPHSETTGSPYCHPFPGLDVILGPCLGFFPHSALLVIDIGIPAAEMRICTCTLSNNS